MTNAILRGKPDAGNPHVRFDEGEVASAKPRRGSLLYKKLMLIGCALLAGAVWAKIPVARSLGRLSDGREAKVWRLEGAGGMILDVSDYGGRLVRCYVPDRFGNLADVTLGWNTAGEYERNGCSMGTLIGRFGNRIKDGAFTLDGRKYQLAVNETTPAPRHCNLHSGPLGWDAKIWDVKFAEEGETIRMDLSCVSEDGDMGFPGTVKCTVTYRVLPNNTWTLDYEAVTDRPTVLNLTHHTYWNMAGEASGGVLGQELRIYADRYTKTDDGLIPVGHEPVRGTGFDFTSPRPVGSHMAWLAAQADLACTGNFYDHNFVLDGRIGELHPAMTLRDPASGRKLEIWTTEPCLQMYGCQDFDGTKAGKTAGWKYPKYAGLVFETQHAPDSPNHAPSADWPSTVLRPGETLRSHSEYRFSAE